MSKLTGLLKVFRRYGRYRPLKRTGLLWGALGLVSAVDEQKEIQTQQAGEFKFELRTLQHPFLIKQATTDVVVSASQTLTVVAAAFQDISQRIRELRSEEILLLRQEVEFGGSSLPEEHHDALISLRGTIQELQNDLTNLQCYLEYAERLATVAAEISHFSGNTIVSDVINQQIQQINVFYNQEVKLNEALEMEYMAYYSRAIESSQNENLEQESKKD